MIQDPANRMGSAFVFVLKLAAANMLQPLENPDMNFIQGISPCLLIY